MKYSLIVLTTVIFNLFPLFAQAQSNAEEHIAVMQTLNQYLQGGTNNDFETLSKAFHPDASMKFISNDGYKEVNAVDFFRNGMKPGPPQNRKTSIISVDISGMAAQAKLQIDYDTFYFVDYMQLLKIDGQWKITSKIFYKVVR